MSGKRSHDQLEGIHESRQQQLHEDGAIKMPAAKKRREGPPKIRKQVHASSVNAVKKRIRDVTRLLNKGDDLPADVRLENERALQAYKQELAEADEEKVRQRMIKKYHMVRFFEKQKASRMLKKLKKRLLETTSTDEVDQITKEMHIYEVDVNYAHYYPLNERYISLYPQRGKEEEDEKTRAKALDPSRKPELWAEIERRMEEGTLKELRYGVREGHVPKAAPKTMKMKSISGANAIATKPRLASETQAFKQQEKKVDAPASRREREPAAAPQLDYTLNRRERRKLGLKTGAIKPAKAPLAKSNKSNAPVVTDTIMEDAGNISDGGFFEE